MAPMLEKTEVRIVAGKLRGRKVQCIVHPGMRPTPQFVREALFSILGNAVPDRIFYDLFAGTGVCGLEAISRGASAARLVEADPKQVQAIQKHIDQFGVSANAQVIRADVFRWADRWMPFGTEPVNLFLSPPFPILQNDKIGEFIALINLLIQKAPIHSVISIQAEEGFLMDDLPMKDAWDIRNYSRNLLLFYVKEPASSESAPIDPEVME